MYDIDLTRPQDSLQVSPLQRLVINAMFDKGLTQETVARRSGLSVATIAALRSGGRGKRPRRDTLERLARGLDVPFAEVLAAAVPHHDGALEHVALRLFRRLSADEQHLVLGQLASMAAGCESGVHTSPRA